MASLASRYPSNLGSHQENKSPEIQSGADTKVHGHHPLVMAQLLQEQITFNKYFTASLQIVQARTVPCTVLCFKCRHTYTLSVPARV